MTLKARHTTHLQINAYQNACAEAATNHYSIWQSHQETLVPFASHSAISGTFNSLSKVLFTFPSRYLFAIGLESIFSFRRKLPPILRTTSKVRDSTKSRRMLKSLHVNGILTLSDAFFQKDLRRRPLWWCLSRLQFKNKFLIYILSSSLFSRPY